MGPRSSCSRSPRASIETGKGVDGALPDIAASDILERLHAQLERGETVAAIDDATSAMARAIGHEPRSSSHSDRIDPLALAGGLAALLLLLIGAVISPRFRSLLFVVLEVALLRGGGRGRDRRGAGGGSSGGGGASGRS